MFIGRRPTMAATVFALTVATTLSATALAKGAHSSTPAADGTLSAQLDTVLADSRLAGSITSLQVLDAATGNVLYSKNADQRVLPASNEKLLTSTTAMSALGPDFRFHTTVGYSGTENGGTVTGDVYLKGTGDPTLTDATIDGLATKIADAGITNVSGGLIADDTTFDHVPLGFSWSWDDESEAYGAPISALTPSADSVFDTGAVAVTTKPGGAAGDAGTITLSPRNSYVRVVNTTKTGAAGSTGTVTAARDHGSNVIRVSGSVPSGGSAVTKVVAVDDPTQVTASAFRDALTRHGVSVSGNTTVKAVPSNATQVFDQASIRLSDLLIPWLKLSNNGHAEILTKAIGHQAGGGTGTWANGLAKIRSTVAGLGVDTSVLTLQDGSGLTRRDYVTTHQIATLLFEDQSQPWFTSWYNALPIGGAADPLVGGTLASRFTGTAAANNVHAKTGTLTSANAISGYVSDTTGKKYVFSAISNNATVNVAAVLDKAVVTLANVGAPATTVKKQLSRVKEAPAAVSPAGDQVECSWINAC